MSDPYLGEIRTFAGNFNPRGWAFCRGQLIPIDQNDALYTLLGTTYGGDGQTTFGLPDLQGRVAIGQGTGGGLSARTVGQKSGSESVTLNTSNLPAHSHTVTATTVDGTSGSPANALPATPALPSAFLYINPAATGTTDAPPAATSITPAGGSQPHTNQMPFLVLNYIIALEGVYPSRN